MVVVINIGNLLLLLCIDGGSDGWYWVLIVYVDGILRVLPHGGVTRDTVRIIIQFPNGAIPNEHAPSHVALGHRGKRL